VNTRFQWLVALRYLMARPRHVSPVLGWICAVLGTAWFASVILENFVWDVQVLEGDIVTEHPYHQLVRYIAIGAGLFFQVFLGLFVVRWLCSFFTTVSVGGVFIGTMALVMVLSVMNGFEGDLREKILGSNAHLRITRVDGDFTEYRDVDAQVRTVAGVEGTSPFLTSEVAIGSTSNYQSVIIKGVQPERLAEVTQLGDKLDEGGFERMWRLDEDGKPQQDDVNDGGEPADTPPIDWGDDVVDPPPDDFALPDANEPIDLSGGAAGETGAAGEEPIDLSGGATDDVPDAEPAEPAEDVEPVDLSGAVPIPDSAPPPLPEMRGAPGADRMPGVGGFEGLPGALGSEDILDSSDIPPPDPMMLREDPRILGLDGVLAGRELAITLNLYVDREVSLVSPVGQMTPAGPVPRSRPFRIGGVFHTGMYEYDTKLIYVTLEALQDFLSLDDMAEGIEVRVADPDRAGEVAQAIASLIGDEYEVRDWRELNRSLFAALKLEKISMFLVLAIIVLVASFSIVCNLIMVVVEKAPEISVFKTMGATDREVMQLFIAQGFVIGVIGSFGGVGLALYKCLTLDVPIPSQVYYISSLPIEIEPLAVGAVLVAGVFISILATLYPAYRATQILPVDGLRDK